MRYAAKPACPAVDVDLEARPLGGVEDRRLGRGAHAAPPVMPRSVRAETVTASIGPPDERAQSRATAGYRVLPPRRQPRDGLPGSSGVAPQRQGDRPRALGHDDPGQLGVQRAGGLRRDLVLHGDVQVALAAVLRGQPRRPPPGQRRRAGPASGGELSHTATPRPSSRTPATSTGGAGRPRRLRHRLRDRALLRARQVVEQGDVGVEVVALGREVGAAQGVEALLDGGVEHRAEDQRAVVSHPGPPAITTRRTVSRARCVISVPCANADAVVLQLAEQPRRPLVEPEVRADRVRAQPQPTAVEQRVADDQRGRRLVQQADAARGVARRGDDPQAAVEHLAVGQPLVHPDRREPAARQPAQHAGGPHRRVVGRVPARLHGRGVALVHRDRRAGPRGQLGGPPAWSVWAWVSTIRRTSPGWRPIARSPATIRPGARFSPQSTSVTAPSASTNA